MVRVSVAALGFVGWFEPLEIGDRRIAGAEDRTLIGGRKKAGVEIVETARRNQPAVEDDETRQVPVLAAEAVAKPGAHARPALQTRTGVQEIIRRGMFRKLRDHRLHNGQIVGALGDVRE